MAVLFLLSVLVSCQEKSTLTKKNYASELKSSVYIDEEQIEFLDLLGKKSIIGCELEIRTGDIFDYKIVDERLQLTNTKSGDKLELNRSEGQLGSIVGVWQATVHRASYRSDIEITIPNHYDIIVVEKCRYGK